MLRHELLQRLLRNAALQLEQVIFCGRLLDRLQEAGVLDDDQAHFRNMVLGKAEVQAQLSNYIAGRGPLEAHHATVLEAHATMTCVTLSETAEPNLLAKDALQQL